MEGYPQLNFPAARLRVRRPAEGPAQVWDPLRGRFLVLTPEEWVRRHLIAWLVSAGVPAANICQEYPVDMSGAPQRADVVVVGRSGRPVLLVECKAPGVGIGPAALEQAVRYNSVLGAGCIMLTDGISHFFYERSGQDYRPLKTLPALF